MRIVVLSMFIMLTFAIMLLMLLVLTKLAAAELNILSEVEELVGRNGEDKRKSVGWGLDSFLLMGLAKISEHMGRDLCKTTGSEFYEASYEIFECMVRARTDGQICITDKDAFKNCVLPLAEILDRCVDIELKGIPTTIVNALTAVNEYICETKIKDIIEIFNPCIQPDVDVLTECVKDEEIEQYKKINEIPNAREFLCSEVKKHGKCIVNKVVEGCKGNRTTKTISDLYNAFFLIPCQL